MSGNHLMSLYKKYNSSQMDIVFSKKLHEYLKVAVDKYPDKIAIRDKQNSITYKEMYERVNEFSSLFEFNNQPIAIIGSKNIDVVCKILGILNSGNYFIPINVDSPTNRINYILDKSRARVFINGDSINFLHDENVETFTKGYMAENDSIAYVIFTSGTTGMPKGVIESHFQVENTIFDLINRLSLNDSDYFLGISAFSFDLSIFDIFAPIMVGGTLHLIEEATDFQEINTILTNFPVTVWNSVPNLMQLYLNSNLTKSNQLKHCLLSGDFISVGLAEQFFNTFPLVDLYSLGGATECSIWSILYKISKEDVETMNYIPYGYPLDNQSIYILDDELNLCSVDEVGEIAISGLGVALGYLNDEDKTNESFISHSELGNIYLTGDLGTFTKSNGVKILGRKKNDYKINGYRLSLNEISNKFYKLFNLESRIFITDDTPQKIILAYQGGISITSNEIISELSQHLLPYEIPNNIFKVESFPLTENGKTDYNKLIDVYIENQKSKRDESAKKLEHTTFKKMLSEKFGTREILPTDSLFDYGANSMEIMEIKYWIEQSTGRKVEMLELYENNTIQDLEEILDVQKKN